MGVHGLVRITDYGCPWIMDYGFGCPWIMDLWIMDSTGKEWDAETGFDCFGESIT
jgi:hypothetical protein